MTRRYHAEIQVTQKGDAKNWGKVAPHNASQLASQRSSADKWRKLDSSSTHLGVAEGVGFEPTIRFPVYTLSKRAPSATRPSLRGTLWRRQYSRRPWGDNPVSP